METIFSAANLLVMPFWLLMIIAPRWKVTVTIMRSPLIVLPIALIYAVLVAPAIPSAFGALANPQLNDIAAMLGTLPGAAIGWIHFLAFDLFVGRWVYIDGQERGYSPWIVSPILFVVLMFGPLGLSVYLIVRTLKRRPAP